MRAALVILLLATTAFASSEASKGGNSIKKMFLNAFFSSKEEDVISAVSHQTFPSHCSSRPTKCSSNSYTVAMYCRFLSLVGCCCRMHRVSSKFCAKPCPTPTPTPCPQATKCPTPPLQPSRHAWICGDPHLKTYDGTLYDCQGCGEFVLSKSPACDAYELQGRFYKRVPWQWYTTLSDVAVTHVDAPTVQVSLLRKYSTPHSKYAFGCRVAFFVNGVSKVFNPGTSTYIGSDPAENKAHLYTTSTYIRLRYHTYMYVIIRLHYWGNRCLMCMDHILPSKVSHCNVRGLFGTPNSNGHDDWTTPGGTSLPIPGPYWDRVTQGTAFCNNHWKVNNAADSLFIYEPGTTHADVKACKTWTGFPSHMMVSSMDSMNKTKESPLSRKAEPKDFPAALRGICGEDMECLVDGREWGVEAAKGLLKDKETSTENRRKYAPDKGFRDVEFPRMPDSPFVKA